MKRLHPSITLLSVAIFAYGFLIPQLGFYWDDLPMSWIRYQLGFEAMTRYFSTNRPVWAMLYQATTRMLPQVPVFWQVFALLMRWLGAVTLWATAKLLFPKNEKFAFTLSILFLLYPGFNQQWVSYLYSHFFIVLFFFLLSYYLMLRGKTIPALIFSALNLWMMEYFFVLELMRPFVIFASLRNDPAPLKERIIHTLKLWTPYLAVFVLAVLSRIFIFNNQVYQFSLRAELARAPLETIFALVQNIFSSFWVTTGAAWSLIFQFPNPAVDGTRTLALYVFVVALVAALILFILRNQVTGQQDRADSAWIISLGLVMLLLAGPPFWLTNLPVSLGFPANRATLSFMLGSSFIFAGLLEFIPFRFKYVLALIFALAAGRQFLWSNEFRRDWKQQKDLFWQMTWRAPALKKNTTVMMNEELKYYADNSLGAALNWIYAPDNHSDVVDYVLFYPTNRKDLSLQTNMPVDYDFIAGEFHGNTSQSVVFYYAPPKCLRLLDPEIDSVNLTIPDASLLREALLLSSTDPILNENVAKMPTVYGTEPAHGWCYYFQTADLSRQIGDWDQVVKLGNAAFALNDYPNDPIERFVFIEGYAHVGDWGKAVELSQVSYKISKEFVRPPLCKLWDRIARETESTSERNVTLDLVRNEFECLP